MHDSPLEPLSQRVLGCLLEKALSTPDYYPLTLAAVVAACNQSSNRDPVLKVEEGEVMLALEDLRDRGLAWFVTPAGSRVQKYEERLSGTRDLSVQESAILAELLLRGPQTPGELRSRCTRMYTFPDLAEVEAALAVLQEGEAPLAMTLPRQPGTKEARLAHLLGPVPTPGEGTVAQAPAAPGRMAQLETEVAELKGELAALRAEFEAFKAQF